MNTNKATGGHEEPEAYSPHGHQQDVGDLDYAWEYQQVEKMLADPNTAHKGRERTLDLIAPLVRMYMWERHGSRIADQEAAQDAESDALMAVLHMLDNYNPEKGKLQHYLTAKSAAWRYSVDASVRQDTHLLKFTDGESRVLALAHRIRSEYEAANPGQHLQGEQWVKSVKDHVQQLERDDPATSAFHVRKGVTSALRNLGELLMSSSSVVHLGAWDDYEEFMPSVHTDHSEHGDLYELAGAGDRDSFPAGKASKAARRLGSGHGQFAYLSWQFPLTAAASS